MTLRRHALPLLAALALVLAVVLAFLARDVRAWETSVAEGDRRFQIAPGGRDLWAPSSQALGGVARRLVGVEDDLEFRRAVQLFRRSRPRQGETRTPADQAVAARAQAALALLERRGPPERRAAASNLLGVLALADALTNPSQAAGRARASIQRFRAALAAVPDHEAAQANLELVLTLLRTQDARFLTEGGARGQGTAPGAGGNQGGQGF